jgi:hypothetical protein
MANIPSDRATGRAFLTDLQGGNIVDFQFAPFTLDFEEGGNYEQRTKIGHHFTDAVWISGQPSMFSLYMFVDRTNESVPMDIYDMPYSKVHTMNHRKPQYNQLTLTNLARLIVKKEYKGEKDFKQSEHFPNPEFAQGYDPARGIYPDLEKLLYFVRPEGINMDNNTIRNSAEVSVQDFEMYRFTAPPMVRFHYGTLWRECYMTNVKYKLSAMNKELVPRRFEADIKLVTVRQGYLENVTNFNNTINTDAEFGKGTNNSRFA